MDHLTIQAYHDHHSVRRFIIARMRSRFAVTIVEPTWKIEVAFPEVVLDPFIGVLDYRFSLMEPPLALAASAPTAC